MTMLGIVINVVTERVTAFGPRGRFGTYSAMFLGLSAYERPYTAVYTMGLIIRRPQVRSLQGPCPSLRPLFGGGHNEGDGDKAGDAFPSHEGAPPAFSRPWGAS